MTTGLLIISVKVKTKRRGGGYRLLGDIDMFTCIDAGERGSASVCLIIQQYTVPHICTCSNYKNISHIWL